jgi:hypothetical protein
LGIGIAKAADSTLFGEADGFRLRNAHRSSIRTERIAHVGEVIHDSMIVAAHDSSKAAAADARFAEISSRALLQTKIRARLRSARNNLASSE